MKVSPFGFKVFYRPIRVEDIVRWGVWLPSITGTQNERAFHARLTGRGSPPPLFFGTTRLPILIASPPVRPLHSELDLHCPCPYRCRPALFHPLCLSRSHQITTDKPTSTIRLRHCRRLYQRECDNLLEHEEIQGRDPYRLAVYATWRPSYEKLDAPARSFLQICSMLHHEGISEENVSTPTRGSQTTRRGYGIVEPIGEARFVLQLLG
jgi:hypothetical protein